MYDDQPGVAEYMDGLVKSFNGIYLCHTIMIIHVHKYIYIYIYLTSTACPSTARPTGTSTIPVSALAMPDNASKSVSSAVSLTWKEMVLWKYGE